ncbi:DUF2076 domain-containing protein [Salinisphaera sp. Q1T1-3]|uniref:DUF2076 domain-containing protein n=1 Tax=Salinisphaera sp. Q1T1-3 TaxID=2321229 RepID=UPI000E76EB88|nr:DUF2076 domain-containing protein [Salinisphaera sp. Q1T1-3]RJS94153.1 DUF2076 domain-containing protein [Salinisphaera sp. Q1T1-3]
MESREKQTIDSLFDRLEQAETQTGPRDTQAEDHIAARVREQPHAPYYMAQAMLVQEAALKKLHARVANLEQRLTTAEGNSHSPSHRSGLLASLFGGRPSTTPRAGREMPEPRSQPPGVARDSGFLGGALQTATGVAGGIMAADMLTGLFHHSQPDEIVDIINEPAPGDSDFSDAGFDGAGDANDGSNTNVADFNDPGYDPGDDTFGGWGDDDSFL